MALGFFRFWDVSGSDCRDELFIRRQCFVLGWVFSAYMLRKCSSAGHAGGLKAATLNPKLNPKPHEV